MSGATKRIVDFYETREVLAGAYKVGGPESAKRLLSHSVELDSTGRALRVLCRNVKLDSLCENGSEAHGPGSRPSCGRCAKRDPRFES